MREGKRYRSYGCTAAAVVLHNSQVGFFEPSLYCLLRRLDPREVADAMRDLILYSIKVDKDSYAKRLIPIFIRALCDREYFSTLEPVMGETGTYQFKSPESAPVMGSCMAVPSELIKLYQEIPIQESHRTFGKPLMSGALETKASLLVEGFRYVQDDPVASGRYVLIDFLLDWHSRQEGEILEQELKMWEGVLRDVIKGLSSESLAVLARRTAESKSSSGLRDSIMKMALIARIKSSDQSELLAMVGESFKAPSAP